LIANAPGFRFNERKLRIQAQLLEEPHLLFGRMGRNPNPKFGLTEYGPFDASHENGGPHEIHVGVVGTGQTIEDCSAWLRYCEEEVAAVEGKARQYPRFPGFNEGHPFRCRLKLNQNLQQRLTMNEIDSIVGVGDATSRFEKALDLLDGKVSLMLEVSNPDVIVLALPDAIADGCWSLGGERLRRGRKGLSQVERVLLRVVERDRKVGQGHLFPEAFELEDDPKPIFVILDER
jgi:hypothetical protein